MQFDDRLVLKDLFIHLRELKIEGVREEAEEKRRVGERKEEEERERKRQTASIFFWLTYQMDAARAGQAKVRSQDIHPNLLWVA